MPLKLYPPQAGRSKNWRIRGSYLGAHVDRSAGTPRKSIAAKALRRLEEDIERGAFGSGPTFLSAAGAYLDAGGERRFLVPLVKHFGATPLARIDQAAVDRAAAALYPPGISAEPSPHNATINRQVHTPVRAVMAAGGVDLPLRRPKQPAGRVRWLTPERAGELIEACGPDLRPLVVFLLYTGCRIGEACRLEWTQVELDRAAAYLPVTKNGRPRLVHLPAPAVAALGNLAHRSGRVFAYPNRHRVYKDWHAACGRIGLADFGPHDLCHTWATWMRRYAGRDERGLVETGRWANRQSVARYVHVVAGEDARAADLLPDVAKAKP